MLIECLESIVNSPQWGFQTVVIQRNPFSLLWNAHQLAASIDISLRPYQIHIMYWSIHPFQMFTSTQKKYSICKHNLCVYCVCILFSQAYVAYIIMIQLVLAPAPFPIKHVLTPKTTKIASCGVFCQPRTSSHTSKPCSSQRSKKRWSCA